MGHDVEQRIPGSTVIDPAHADRVRAMLAGMDDADVSAAMLGVTE